MILNIETLVCCSIFDICHKISNIKNYIRYEQYFKNFKANKNTGKARSIFYKNN